MYGINYYANGIWTGFLRSIPYESDVRELAETWVAENPHGHGYELIECGLIFESRMKG